MVVSQEVGWEAAVEGSSLQPPSAAPPSKAQCDAPQIGLWTCLQVWRRGSRNSDAALQERERQPLGKKEIVVEKACYNS